MKPIQVTDLTCMTPSTITLMLEFQKIRLLLEWQPLDMLGFCRMKKLMVYTVLQRLCPHQDPTPSKKDSLNTMRLCRLLTIRLSRGCQVLPLANGPLLEMDVIWLHTATMDHTGLDMMMQSQWLSKPNG